jgi:hypothetical protein
MTANLTVTLVTANAGQPEDDAAFMRELLDLRRRHTRDDKAPTLSEMLVILGEPPHRKGFWSHRLADPPTRKTFPPEARAVIRAAVGEAPPPTPVEVASTMISERASMWLVGELDEGERAERVVMFAGDEPAELSMGSAITAKRIQAVLRASTTTEDKTHAPATVTHGTPKQKQRSGITPSRVPTELNERRQAIGASWQQIIEAGLKAMEESNG